ncbi:MAG: hypothetical protein CL917_04040 [Deltaproteobacteria bacterium]|nr:hypothetical protein [Deltaproteobacteria bacterium]
MFVLHAKELSKSVGSRPFRWRLSMSSWREGMSSLVFFWHVGGDDQYWVVVGALLERCEYRFVWFRYDHGGNAKRPTHKNVCRPFPFVFSVNES